MVAEKYEDPKSMVKLINAIDEPVLMKNNGDTVAIITPSMFRCPQSGHVAPILCGRTGNDRLFNSSGVESIIDYGNGAYNVQTKNSIYILYKASSPDLSAEERRALQREPVRTHTRAEDGQAISRRLGKILINIPVKNTLTFRYEDLMRTGQDKLMKLFDDMTRYGTLERPDSITVLFNDQGYVYNIDAAFRDSECEHHNIVDMVTGEIVRSDSDGSISLIDAGGEVKHFAEELAGQLSDALGRDVTIGEMSRMTTMMDMTEEREDDISVETAIASRLGFTGEVKVVSEGISDAFNRYSMTLSGDIDGKDTVYRLNFETGMQIKDPGTVYSEVSRIDKDIQTLSQHRFVPAPMQKEENALRKLAEKAKGLFSRKDKDGPER